MPKYLVETVTMFRIRYVVDCENAESAKDAVAMQEPDEFSQEHIDENILSCRQISDEEIPTMFFEDHPYLVGRFDDSYVFDQYVYKVPNSE